MHIQYIKLYINIYSLCIQNARTHVSLAGACMYLIRHNKHRHVGTGAESSGYAAPPVENCGLGFSCVRVCCALMCTSMGTFYKVYYCCLIIYNIHLSCGQIFFFF